VSTSISTRNITPDPISAAVGGPVSAAEKLTRLSPSVGSNPVPSAELAVNDPTMNFSRAELTVNAVSS
jgi:hypothetical protein